MQLDVLELPRSVQNLASINLNYKLKNFFDFPLHLLMLLFIRYNHIATGNTVKPFNPYI